MGVHTWGTTVALDVQSGETQTVASTTALSAAKVALLLVETKRVAGHLHRKKWDLSM